MCNSIFIVILTIVAFPGGYKYWPFVVSDTGYTCRHGTLICMATALQWVLDSLLLYTLGYNIIYI